MDAKLNLQMKELKQLAKQKGKILPVTKAFEMYPAEEEEHKGKIDYWQKQENLV